MQIAGTDSQIPAGDTGGMSKFQQANPDGPNLDNPPAKSNGQRAVGALARSFITPSNSSPLAVTTLLLSHKLILPAVSW